MTISVTYTRFYELADRHKYTQRKKSVSSYTYHRVSFGKQMITIMNS